MRFCYMLAEPPTGRRFYYHNLTQYDNILLYREISHIYPLKTWRIKERHVCFLIIRWAIELSVVFAKIQQRNICGLFCENASILKETQI
jgi:hypothetical protein